MAQSDDERREKSRIRAAKWRAENPDRVKAYNRSDKAKDAVKASIAKKPEHYAGLRQKWEVSHRARRRELRQARHAENPLLGRARAMRYLRKPGVRGQVAMRARMAKNRPEVRERIRLNKQNRRARVKGGRLSRGITAKLLKLQRWKCVGCGCDLRISGHELDHILPLALDGEHEDRNMQLLCPPCNRRKNATHPITWAQSRGLLL